VLENEFLLHINIASENGTTFILV